MHYHWEDLAQKMLASFQHLHLEGCYGQAYLNVSESQSVSEKKVARAEGISGRCREG